MCRFDPAPKLTPDRFPLPFETGPRFLLRATAKSSSYRGVALCGGDERGHVRRRSKVSLHPNDKDVATFWAWFASIADELGDDLTNEALHDELDARLARLGEIAWELGPGSTAENALAISPDGNPALLRLTQRIVAMAPTLPRWEFHSSRPARAESLEFSISTTAGDEIAIDARSWKYVLYRLPNKTFDIVVEQPNLDGATDDDRYTAAIVLLDGLLGEGKRLLRIGDIEPVVALKADEAKKSNIITMLSEQLDSLC